MAQCLSHPRTLPEPPTNPEPVVYQPRVVLRGVSPLIWRRLLIRSVGCV